MMTPISIIKLIFDEGIKSGTRETVRELFERIKTKFRGNNRAENALEKLQLKKDDTLLNLVAKHLDLEMTEDEVFANEIKKLARQINLQNSNSQNKVSINIKNGKNNDVIVNNNSGTINSSTINNIGRDKVTIDKIVGDVKIGGS